MSTITEEQMAKMGEAFQLATIERDGEQVTRLQELGENLLKFGISLETFRECLYEGSKKKRRYRELKVYIDMTIDKMYSILQEKENENKYIAIPYSEIRKKLHSLNISEEQFKEFLINKYENENRQDMLEGVDKYVEQIYHPTEEELQREEEYINKLKEQRIDIDFQEHLSERSTFKSLFS